MIVLDASAAVDLLLAVEPHASNLWTIIAERGSRLAAPHLIDAEIGQVMRRLVLARAIPKTRALGVLEDLAGLPLQRFAHGGLLERAFALHQNLTIYDALYVVLAEALRVPLVTRDKALAQVPGHRAKVIVLWAPPAPVSPPRILPSAERDLLTIRPGVHPQVPGATALATAPWPVKRYYPVAWHHETPPGLHGRRDGRGRDR